MAKSAPESKKAFTPTHRSSRDNTKKTSPLEGGNPSLKRSKRTKKRELSTISSPTLPSAALRRIQQSLLTQSSPSVPLGSNSPEEEIIFSKSDTDSLDSTEEHKETIQKEKNMDDPEDMIAEGVLDGPDAAINEHIANLSVTDKSEIDDSTAKSPMKKKSKKGRRLLKSATVSSSTTSSLSTPSSILRDTHVAPLASTTHNHKFKRVIIDASVVLTAEAERDRYEEFNHSLGVLLKNAVMVDSTVVFNPRDPSAKYADWKLPKDVPSNYTELGRFVWISSVPWKFKTHSQKRAENTVYFSFNMSSDVPPEVVCSSIAMEWGRQNGDRVAVKAVQYHDTCTPIALFFLWNEGPADTFIQELTLILKTAWEVALLNKDELLPPAIIIPEFGLRKILPQIKGAKPPAFGPNIPVQLQNARKVYHMEVGKVHADLFRHLVTIAKERKIFAAIWGGRVHPSEVLEADPPLEARMNLASMSQYHASYIYGSRVERLIGVTMLDKTVDLVENNEVKQSLSLRDVLLEKFRTKEGATVFGSIHQGGVEEPFVIVQNSAEIESLMMRLNHHLPAFLYFYLQEKRFPKEFVTDLLRKSCDPVLFASIFECTWDSKDQVVTRPDDEELKRKREEEERSQQWYKDIINIHLITTQKSPPRAHVPPEALYDLDAVRSVGTINPHRKKVQSVKNAKVKNKAKSTGDSDSLGDDSDNSDSASDNATSKPFSKVGFAGKKTVNIDTIALSSSSDEESSAADDDGESQNSMGEGKGG
jgi:hypothetical protein